MKRRWKKKRKKKMKDERRKERRGKERRIFLVRDQKYDMSVKWAVGAIGRFSPFSSWRQLKSLRKINWSSDLNCLWFFRFSIFEFLFYFLFFIYFFSGLPPWFILPSFLSFPSSFDFFFLCELVSGCASWRWLVVVATESERVFDAESVFHQKRCFNFKFQISFNSNLVIWFEDSCYKSSIIWLQLCFLLHKFLLFHFLFSFFFE